MENKSEILLYQTEDGKTKIDVHIDGETVWLNQGQMVELFQTSKQNISLHIRNCFREGELAEKQVVKEYLTTANDGKSYKTKHYNLDVIISVGYRVKSHRGTQFRIWATERLREYIIKGFTLNDDLLKQSGGGNYFDELLERIRDIRSSEKVFWRKVLDIYATSIDYDPSTQNSIDFFKTVQNKMHWAAHGHTAAEIVYQRADADKPFMGLTNFEGAKPKKSEISTAKNYLSKDELDILNRMVTAYLEFAELQALRRNPMYMRDWISRLDDFLKMTQSDILEHAGTISHEDAVQKAEIEYSKYKDKTKEELSEAEKDFIKAIDKAEKDIKEIGS